MKIISYVHPIRTYLPCTGVGRHINNLVLGLSDRDDIDLKLLFAKQWLMADGRLDPRSPLSSLPFTTFASNDSRTQWAWKLLGLPQMDSYIPDNTDWVYAPMETYLPIAKCPMAISLHDIQAFETDLPWSHTWEHRWFAYRWASWVPKVLRDCRVVLTVSEFSKQRMVALLGADPRKIAVIGNGVESAFFEIAKIDPASLTPPLAAPYTIVVGGLRLRKGADYVLAVAKALQQRHSDLQIAIAGDSEPEYVIAAREYPNIKLLGMVSDAELPALLRGASSLLFLSPYEGFGIPALEAMAAGIPTVVADRASLPEVVGDAGIVVDPTVAEPIVDILHDLDRLPQLRAEYIQRGAERAATYTWASCVQRLVDTFHTFA
jgi:glycosyltransferase involved in cell wall biosynthesis